MRVKYFLYLVFQIWYGFVCGQIRNDSSWLLQPARVFDGNNFHENWWVLVDGAQIREAGPARSFQVPAKARIITLKGMTLLPGLIEGHSHLFLHPYNETSWDDQVLTETRAERVSRAVNHARSTLMAGFTTTRDLGTEGAGYDDVGIKSTIGKGIIVGPRMLVATRAIVLKGTYGPKSPLPEMEIIRGAAEVTGGDELVREALVQMSHGADLIKVYGDYRWGKEGAVTPTFTEEELTRLAKLVRSSGRLLVVHAAGPEAMRRAANAGATTIEHGDEGTREVFELMKQKGVAYCPTLAAAESYMIYDGWKKGEQPDPDYIKAKKKSFEAALASGVTICMGGDVGVFSHGDNWREMALMAEYGMNKLEVLRSATSVNARVFGLGDKLGLISKGFLADLVAVEGDPLTDLSVLKKVTFVMKNGSLVKQTIQ